MSRQTREKCEHLERWYMTVRKCTQCGKEFGADSRRAVFCSDACKMKDYRARKNDTPV